MGIPKILLIDDQPNMAANGLCARLTSSFDGEDEYKAEAKSPEEVVVDELHEADLTLVDYRLDHWDERDTAPVSRSPENGHAVAMNIRTRLADSTCLALFTSHLDELTYATTSEDRRHLIADEHGVDWVFSKLDDHSRERGGQDKFVNQARTLADGFHELQSLPGVSALSEADDNDWEEFWGEVLAIDQVGVSDETLMGDVKKCNPPQQKIMDTGNRRPAVWWLMHEVFPYPTFLLDKYYVAARLAVSVESLEKIVGEDSWLSEKLAEFEYSGLFSGFDGERWWREGISAFLWDELGGQSNSNDAIFSFVDENTDVDVSRAPERPVVVVHEDERIGAPKQLISVEHTTDAMLEFWPGFAETPWVEDE